MYLNKRTLKYSKYICESRRLHKLGFPDQNNNELKLRFSKCKEKNKYNKMKQKEE